MGFFSWHTNDTDEVIWNKFAKEANEAGETKTVYMIDNKGNKWKEDNYEGYGVFGGLCYYDLLAKMNGLKTRSEAIDLVYSGKPYIAPQLVIDSDRQWENVPPREHSGQGFWG